MKNLINTGQILQREEMKKIMAGSTNCWLCSTGGFSCANYEEEELPEEEGTTCSWGTCPEC